MALTGNHRLTAARIRDPSQRALSIACVAPFIDWPAASVIRLALASRVVTRQGGAYLLTRGARVEDVYVVVAGDVTISLSARGGRTIVFAIARPGAGVFGLGSLVDGAPMANDVAADPSVVAVAIPIAAVRAELAADPARWESVAREAVVRARYSVDRLNEFLLEPLRSRAVRLLLGLADVASTKDEHGATVIDLKLPQERLGEMLGVSRQTAASLVRDLTAEGLLKWRYGRATLVDLERLHAITGNGPPSTERPHQSHPG